ncbi:MAG: methylated-DNA--[protein]-cysteine S-methyltransferase [Gammaproteobacteria bacterium]|jgi:methylated-DNA-[protein]-cysteine S-methyltransferase|nr:methylated-DNA--[protein]-cysteine S-methyltransferase [Gammaproteobacteria bacterium]
MPKKTDLMSTEQVVINTPFTRMALMFEAGILCSVGFMAQQELCAPKSEQARKACQQIHDYCTKQLPDLAFDIELQVQGTSFQKRVWQALRRIPAGQVLSYGELARQLNTSARAIGGACRANPVPLIIPCHRIVAKDGMGGFAGSTEGASLNIKRRLLEHEGVL